MTAGETLSLSAMYKAGEQNRSLWATEHTENLVISLFRNCILLVLCSGLIYPFKFVWSVSNFIES